MKNEFIDTLVVGAGQAGLAISEHLSNHGVSHIIIEIYTLQKQTNEKIIRQVDYIDLNSFSTLLRKQNPVCIRKANTQLP